MTAAAATGSGGSNRMLSLAETAELIGISPSALYRRWRTWGLPGSRAGGRLTFRERNVRTWLARRPDGIPPLARPARIGRTAPSAAQAQARRELADALRDLPGLDEADVELLLGAAEAVYARLKTIPDPGHRQRGGRGREGAPGVVAGSFLLCD